MGDERLMGFVPTADGERARSFYGDVLGLEFMQDDGFALVFRSGGNMVRVVRMGEFVPVPFTILGWETDSIATRVTSLREKGLAFLRFSHFEQDEDGVWTAPDGAKVAWFKDPDGNVLSISQH